MPQVCLVSVLNFDEHSRVLRDAESIVQKLYQKGESLGHAGYHQWRRNTVDKIHADSAGIMGEVL